MKQLFRKVCCVFMAVFFFISTKAQIVYTAINPDTTINAGNVYYLDLDNDGTYDFAFSVSHATGVGHCGGRCSAEFTNSGRVFQAGLNNGDSIMDNSPTCEGCALGLDCDSAIDSSAHWSSAAKILYQVEFCTCGGTSYIGYWGSHYLGVKFASNGYDYYGWVQLTALDVSGNGGLSISGYAYNKDAGQPIFAGEGASCNTLPVTILNFEASIKNNKTELTWSATNGINSTGFEVQKSFDAENFSAIGSVSAKKNNSSENQYTFTDEGVESENNFYRLKQTDLDGKFTYSDIVKIHTVNSDEINIAPNPVLNSTSISFTLQQSQNVSAQIFDLNGRLVKTLFNNSMTAGNHQIIWNARNENESDVTSGIYLLKLQRGNEVKIKKISVIK